MSTKHYLAAILTAAILSIGFLSCNPDDDEPPTNPTPSTDVVKEVYGFFGKPTAQVVQILDAKGWTKYIDSTDLGVIYNYFNIDSTKTYAVYSIDDTINRSLYCEYEQPIIFNQKLTSNTSKFLSLFEKWEQSFLALSTLNSVYQGFISADDSEFQQYYADRAAFLTDYQAKKSTIEIARSGYSNAEIQGFVNVYLDYETEDSGIIVVFMDSQVKENKGETTKNSWFRR